MDLPFGRTAQQDFEFGQVFRSVYNYNVVRLYGQREQQVVQVLLPRYGRKVLLQIGKFHWVVQLGGVPALFRCHRYLGQSYLEVQRLFQFLDGPVPVSAEQHRDVHHVPVVPGHGLFVGALKCQGRFVQLKCKSVGRNCANNTRQTYYQVRYITIKLGELIFLFLF